jgi:DNA-binding LytR/AlgR family response regulator
MTINCYVIDDESAAIALLKEYIGQTPGLELVGCNQNPLDALDILTGKDAPDLTFIDIDMRQLSGLELAGMVNLYTSVVFTTAFPQYALQAFEKEAFDYLLKPINYERFLKCIQRTKRRMKLQHAFELPPNDGFFNIKSETKGRMLKIRFEEVMYIEGADNYILIHTTEGKHLTYLTMKEIGQHLPRQVFVRIHHSFIVNIHFVKVIEQARVQLQNKVYLSMGTHYKSSFLELMEEHLVKDSRAS